MSWGAGCLAWRSILAGLVPPRVGAPVLLVFLAFGMIGGEDSVFGIAFDDFPRST
jgi:NhaP-type Na+/H+ and K+/H+ antiporter